MARGKNDFNPLTIVRRPSDEVYLHSKMIAALLDPNGHHYQRTLFLELFLQTIGLASFFENPKEVQVWRERWNIDLMLYDGERCVIIENKLNAADGPCQLISYINIARHLLDLSLKHNENGDPKVENLKVVYLTKSSGRRPSEHIIENGVITFNGSDEKLERCSKYPRIKKLVPDGLKRLRADAISISYEKEILQWLERCYGEISHITNLSQAITFYRESVERALKRYRSKVVPMSNLLKEHPDQIQNAYITKHTVNDMLGELLFEMFEALFADVQNRYHLEPIKLESKYYKTYTSQACKKWLKNDIKKEIEFVGFSFRLDDRYALRVEAATKHVHVGVVAYKREGDRFVPDHSDEAISELKNILSTKGLRMEERKWKEGQKRWFSTKCGNYNKGDNENVITCLRNPLDSDCCVKKSIDTIIKAFQTPDA
jgi:hypothetical protein